MSKVKLYVDRITELRLAKLLKFTKIRWLPRFNSYLVSSFNLSKCWKWAGLRYTVVRMCQISRVVGRVVFFLECHPSRDSGLGTRNSGIQDSRDPPVFDLRKRLPDSPKGLSGKSDLRKYRIDKVRKIWCITES